MNRRTFLATGAVLLGGCLSGGDEPDADTTESPAVVIVEHERRTKAGMYYIAGVVENTTDDPQEFQVLVTWYDTDDTVLGESFSQTRADIEPGERRMFDTTLYDPSEHGEPDRYTLSVKRY